MLFIKHTQVYKGIKIITANILQRPCLKWVTNWKVATVLIKRYN